MGPGEQDRGHDEEYRVVPQRGVLAFNPDTGVAKFSPKFRIAGHNIAKPYDTVRGWYGEFLKERMGR